MTFQGAPLNFQETIPGGDEGQSGGGKVSSLPLDPPLCLTGQ